MFQKPPNADAAHPENRKTIHANLVQPKNDLMTALDQQELG
jgi:hypothetical protein